VTPAPASASFEALGTTASVAVANASALDEARALLEARLARVDGACSRFRSDSELVAANRAAGRRVAVSDLLRSYLDAALEAARSTAGIVDPTLGAEVRRLGYDRTYALVSTRDGFRVGEAAPQRPCWKAIQLDDDGLLAPPGTELDLGATAKALAADQAAGAIAAATGVGTLVSLGGDVAVAGEPPAGGWCIGVAEDHRAEAQAVVLLESGGLATSTITVRRWRTDAGEANHLLDPRTLAPVGGAWRTATVAARSCLEANIAATAALVLDTLAVEWLRERGLPARLVDRAGEVLRVGGWPSDREPAP
jgi:thiamine biosynthesis lipoprotein